MEPEFRGHQALTSAKHDWQSLPATKEALDQIPCILQTQSMPDTSATKQLCYLNIAQDAVAAITDPKKNFDGSKTLKMLQNPGTLGEALGANVIFQMSEPAVFTRFQVSESKDIKQFDASINDSIKDVVDRIEFGNSLQRALQNNEVRQLFANKSLSLAQIHKTIETAALKVGNADFLRSLQFLENNYEFIAGRDKELISPPLSTRIAVDKEFLADTRHKGLSLSQMVHFDAEYSDFTARSSKPLREKDNIALDAARRVIAAIATDRNQLYAHKENPAQDIVPEAVNQTFNTAVCVPLAIFASLADTNRKQEIFDWFHPQADGSVSVKFPGAAEVSLPKADATPLLSFVESPGYGNWTKMALKGFTGSLPCKLDSCSEIERIMPEYKLNARWGFESEPAIELITGHKALSLNQQEIGDTAFLARTLTQAFKENRVVIASDLRDDSEVSGKIISTHHQLSVMRLENGIVTIRDPYGRNSVYKDTAGYIKMPIEKFAQEFSQVSVETNEPIGKTSHQSISLRPAALI